MSYFRIFFFFLLLFCLFSNLIFGFIRLLFYVLIFVLFVLFSYFIFVQFVLFLYLFFVVFFIQSFKNLLILIAELPVPTGHELDCNHPGTNRQILESNG